MRGMRARGRARLSHQRVSDANRRMSGTMTERFTDSQMRKLAITYRDYEHLWNVSSELYKDRAARDKAYKEIAEKLKIPGITTKDIPKKIKNLRSSYYQELRKIEKGNRFSGEPKYKPHISWFALVDSFLKPFIHKRETFVKTIEHSSTISDNGSENETSDSAMDTYVEDNSNTANAAVISPKIPLKRRKSTTGNDEDMHKTIEKLDKIAESITNIGHAIAEKKEDEFDVFGKYIAATLRSIPGELAIMAKTEVQKALSDIQLKALRPWNNEPSDVNVVKFEIYEN